MNKKWLMLSLLGVSVVLSGCPKKEDAATDTPPGGVVKKTGDTPKPAESPKDVALKFSKAVMDGDTATAKSYLIPNADAEKSIEIVSNLMGGVKKFVAVADEKFGAEAKQITDPLTQGMPDLAKQIGDAEFKEEGDTVTVISATKKDKPTTLKKTNGVWKIDGSTMSLPADQASQFQSMTKVLSDMTDEIKAGKYKTAQEAMTAFGQKMQAAQGTPPGPGGNMPANTPPGPK